MILITTNYLILQDIENDIHLVKTPAKYHVDCEETIDLIFADVLDELMKGEELIVYADDEAKYNLKEATLCYMSSPDFAKSGLNV